MKNDYVALNTLINGLNASSMDLRVTELIQVAVNSGNISGAELIAYAAVKDQKISSENYGALMFILQGCDDEVIEQ